MAHLDTHLSQNKLQICYQTICSLVILYETFISEEETLDRAMRSKSLLLCLGQPLKTSAERTVTKTQTCPMQTSAFKFGR